MAQLSKLDGPVPRAIDERMSPETRAAYIPQVWVPSIPLRSLKAPETQENRDGGIMIIAIAVAVGSSSTMSCESLYCTTVWTCEGKGPGRQ